jgi:probable HAF family extracellular repeat protein
MRTQWNRAAVSSNLETLEGRRLMAASPYTVVDLGIVDATQGQATVGINEAGQVFNAKGVWSLGKKGRVYYTPLATEQEKKNLFANDLNDQGQLAGNMYYSMKGYQPTIFSPQKGGKPHAAFRVDSPTPKDAKGLGINNLTQVVGTATTASYGSTAFLANLRKGKVAMVDLDKSKPAGVTMELRRALDINEAGLIIVQGGTAGSNANDRGAIVRVTKKGVTVAELPYLTADKPTATPQGINELGQIVGYSGVPGYQTAHAVLWQSTKKGIRGLDLGTLGGDDSRAVDINDKGQIVGTAEPNIGLARAVVWTPGKKGRYGVTDLYAAAKPSGFYVRYATGINEQGWISAEGTGQDGKQHALLLVPNTKGVTAAATAETAKSPAVAPTAKPAPMAKASLFSAKRVADDGVWN